MNQKIKELSRQAGAHISTRNLMSIPPQQVESVELWDDRIEKFAELIIQECIETSKETCTELKAVDDIQSPGFVTSMNLYNIMLRNKLEEKFLV